MRTKDEANVIEYAQYLKRARSEAGFQRSLEHFAKLMGWRIFHDRDSRKNDEGFPDFVGVRDGQLVFAELKVGKNTRSEAQVAWGDALEEVQSNATSYWEGNPGDGWEHPVRYFLWYPSDWEEIVAVIKQPWIEVELT